MIYILIALPFIVAALFAWAISPLIKKRPF